MVADLLLPLSPPDFLDSCNRSIASGAWRHVSSGNSGIPRRWNDYGSPSCRRGDVDRSRVVCSVGDEVRNVGVDLDEEIGDGSSIVGVTTGEHLRDDHAGSIDAEMELPVGVKVVVA
jgi:hypothetical protein